MCQYSNYKTLEGGDILERCARRRALDTSLEDGSTAGISQLQINIPRSDRLLVFIDICPLNLNLRRSMLRPPSQLRAQSAQMVCFPNLIQPSRRRADFERFTCVRLRKTDDCHVKEPKLGSTLPCARTPPEHDIPSTSTLNMIPARAISVDESGQCGNMHTRSRKG
jgi:hypothetical protein